jgi:hypothetical protein
MPEESPQENSSQNLSGSSEDQRKEAEKKSNLDKVISWLLGIVVGSIITLVFFNYAICNIKHPLNLQYLYTVNGLSKDKVPPSKCDDTNSKSIETLVGLLATLIALKTRL